jgi:hypothetical protein
LLYKSIALAAICHFSATLLSYVIEYLLSVLSLLRI